MNDNIIKFPNMADVPSEDEMDETIIVTRLKNGDYFFGSSTENIQMMLWLCKKFEQELLENYDE